MSKLVKMTIITCLAIIINLVPMFLQGIESTVLISYAIMWFSITVFSFQVNFFNNKLISSVIVALLISGPSTIFILVASVTGYVWTILWIIITAVIIGVSQNDAKKGGDAHE